MTVEREKQVAAEAAAEVVEDGMIVGLGTGSTVAYLLPALAAPAVADHLRRHFTRDRPDRNRAGDAGVPVRRAGCAAPARYRHRRRRPGRSRRLDDQGRRGRPHPREDRRRGRRPIRRHRLLGQDGRSARPTRTTGAAGVRTERDPGAAGRGQAARRAAQSRRRGDRRLHRPVRRPRRARRRAVTGGRASSITGCSRARWCPRCSSAAAIRPSESRQRSALPPRRRR